MKSDAPRVVAPQSIDAKYRLLRATRPSFGADETRALAYYSPLFEFISGLVPAGADRESARLLDVGCGSGWSTYGFAALLGYDATGIDVNASAFEPPSHERCTLVVGEATAIPYRDESFDVVACFQTLEHVPAPATALDEMIRVCRARGVIAIVGPNLMSPFPGLAYWAWPSRWKALAFRRRPGMQRHPYGNTLWELLWYSVARAGQLAVKLVRRTPRFTMRAPDSVPPYHADNDSCYLCNPTDLIRFFRRRGLTIERRGKPGRPPFSYLFAGGTWVAARKA